MRRCSVIVMATCIWTACEPARESERARFDALVERYLEATKALDPEWATSVGFHESDSLSTAITAESFRARQDTAQALYAALAEIDTTPLDPERRVDWLVLRAELKRTLREAPREEWRRRPSVYIRFGGVHDLLVGEWATPEARLRAAARRLERMPEALEIARAQLSNPPLLWTQMGHRDARAAARFLRGEFPERLGEITPALRDTLRRVGVAVARALDAYADFLRDTLEVRSTGDWAAGEEHYDWLLREYHLLPLTADSLIRLGWRALEETERALQALADSLAPGRTWRELTEEAKERHPGAGDVRAAYEREMRRALAFIREKDLFEVPPGEDLKMIDTPPTLRTTYPYGGYDAPAPFDSVHVGRFFVTPVEPRWRKEEIEAKLRGHNYGWITVVSVHEGYPGHHLQYVKAFRNASVVRKIFSNTYFTEGWGLYSEEVMGRHGFYADPDARLAQLRMRLWRAARVVIDPSIHSGRMTYDEAVRFLVERVGLEEPDALGEVNRYTTWPTQAPSYLVGMAEIASMRETVAAALGGRFQEKAFHEALLTGGSLPMGLARRSLRNRLGIA
ncbi:MAG: DUF885 domain-containing protein [Gemmatimonadetes bacterium]|nr:DUF885 domain-containing protein [Gemmatimonadota bacterium]